MGARRAGLYAVLVLTFLLPERPAAFALTRLAPSALTRPPRTAALRTAALLSSASQPASGAESALDGGAATMLADDTTDVLQKPAFGATSTLEEETDFSVNTILKQLESIQQGTPKNIVILGTRHCSFLHQQIIELLSYALVLSDNHLFTSGATGTHAAAIRGALRAGNQELLTVILPQTLERQPREIRELLGQVERVVELGHNELPLDAASR